MNKVIISILSVFTLISISYAQTLTQSVRGKVYDVLTKTALPGVNVIVLNSEPPIGAATDLDGNFVINNVPVGRHNIQVQAFADRMAEIQRLIKETGRY